MVTYIKCLLFFTELSTDAPTLMDLLAFPGKNGDIDIPEQISTKYTHFGIFLLNDRTGARVNAIEMKHREDAQKINLKILQEWLEGNGKQPVTWKTLVDVLCKIGLSELANDIKAVKL